MQRAHRAMAGLAWLSLLAAGTMALRVPIEASCGCPAFLCDINNLSELYLRG